MWLNIRRKNEPDSFCHVTLTDRTELKLNHDFKKLEKEQIKLITKKFSEFAKIDTPLTEKEILELEEYYNNTFI